MKFKRNLYFAPKFSRINQSLSSIVLLSKCLTESKLKYGISLAEMVTSRSRYRNSNLYCITSYEI